MKPVPLPRGIVPVLQTPFAEDGAIDWESYGRLIGGAIAAGADGLIAPAVASETAYLTEAERALLARFAMETIAGRVPFILGASSDDVDECRRYLALGRDLGAAACLVAVPQSLYKSPDYAVIFFHNITRGNPIPLIVQDLSWNGFGLPLPTIADLRNQVASVAGFKIETVPAGPKYTAVRHMFGDSVHIAGGWAVPQMIEALDRGVDALVPEASMVRAYKHILELHRAGRRAEATDWFHRLLPALAFSNQEINTSIAFFKRLLKSKGVFQSERMRAAGFQWDEYNSRIADERIESYLQLESAIQTQSK